MSEVKLEDFFDFGEKVPINRLAFTDEDIKYKVQVIKMMNKLGMTVRMDKIGNICGEMKLGNGKGKTIAIGSHTDSVYNGGQYDGPVGVISGLKVAESAKEKSGLNGKLLVCVYACEESSRFGAACLGSKFLAGEITEEDFAEKFDQKALKQGEEITLADEVEKYREAIKEAAKEANIGVDEVDKIFENVDCSFETHIE